jgi:hypothetical protein
LAWRSRHRFALCAKNGRHRRPDSYASKASIGNHNTARINGGMNPAWAELTGYSQSTKVPMLVTLVAILCNSQLCLEKVVTTSEQSGITMTACQVNAQIGIADWLAKGPYHDWRLQGYKCVMGKYIPKNDA